MERLLIVDDEPRVLAGLRRGLGREYDLDTVCCARDALQLIERGERYAAIVSDLSMADMDGLMLLERARKLVPFTPRILLTGHCEPSVLMGAINRAGVAAFLRKPVQPSDLAAALKRVTADAPGRDAAAAPDALPADLVWMAQDLAKADFDRELKVLIQPRIDVADGRLVAGECLLRWAHPTRGPIPPAHFVPVAEATNQIDRITDWVLGQAGCAWRRLSDAGCDLSLSVNVALTTLRSDRLPGVIRRVLDLHGMPGHQLEIEITESHRIAHPGSVSRSLAALRAMGVRASLDDFGTGYSSLEALRALEVDTLKIDRGFVSHLGRNPRDTEIVRSITELARALRMNVVAEGVETVDHARVLHQLGVHQFQGWLFAPAMAPEGLLQPDLPWSEVAAARPWLDAVQH